VNKEKHVHGFTIWRATERIWKREDNTYSKKAIENILKMYAEECLSELMDGGKVSIKGVGTIRANIVKSAHCGLPNVKNKGKEIYTFVRVRFRTSDLFKEKLNERLRENLEAGIDGLKGEDE
jgi:nucleoid DNA-binding protein